MKKGNVYKDNKLICEHEISQSTIPSLETWKIDKCLNCTTEEVTFIFSVKDDKTTKYIGRVTSSDIKNEVFVHTEAAKLNVAPKIIDIITCNNKNEKFWNKFYKRIQEVSKKELSKNFKSQTKKVIVMKFGGQVTLTNFLGTLFFESDGEPIKYTKATENKYVNIFFYIIEDILKKIFTMNKNLLFHTNLYLNDILVKQNYTGTIHDLVNNKKNKQFINFELKIINFGTPARWVDKINCAEHIYQFLVAETRDHKLPAMLIFNADFIRFLSCIYQFLYNGIECDTNTIYNLCYKHFSLFFMNLVDIFVFDNDLTSIHTYEQVQNLMKQVFESSYTKIST